MRCSSFPFEHLDQVFGGRTFPFPQSLQLFFGPASELTHPFREHLENLIPSRHLGLGDETDQQCETFGGSKVPEISGVQRESLLCLVFYFSVPQALLQGLL